MNQIELDLYRTLPTHKRYKADGEWVCSSITCVSYYHSCVVLSKRSIILITVVLVTTDLSMVYIVAYIHYFGLLYVAWADQRHRQCCIRHTEQFLNGTVLYDGRQGEGGRTFAFPRFGELSSA